MSADRRLPPADLPRPPRPALSSPLTALDLLRVLLAGRRALLFVPLLCGVAVVGFGVNAKRKWTSSAALLPQSTTPNVNRLAGLAAQFGVSVGGGQGGQSPEYYADILRSDGMLRRLLATTFTTSGGDSIRLAARLVPAMPEGAARDEFALRELRNRVAAGSGIKTGIVRVSASLDDPELARQVVARLISEINALSVEAQQSLAAQERAFTDQRLALARTELRQAEDRLEAFLRGNRLISGGPGLVLQEERLRRDVSLRQQVMVGLAQALEQARVDEVRSIPLLMTVEAPVRPALPDSRRLALKAIFAAIVAATLVAALLLVGEWRRRFALQHPQQAAEMDALTRDALLDATRPWRLFTRRAA